jgi:hypothetical protein
MYLTVKVNGQWLYKIRQIVTGRNKHPARWMLWRPNRGAQIPSKASSREPCSEYALGTQRSQPADGFRVASPDVAMKRIPRLASSWIPETQCTSERPKRSSFHTTTTSNFGVGRPRSVDRDQVVKPWPRSSDPDTLRPIPTRGARRTPSVREPGLRWFDRLWIHARKLRRS